MISEPKIETRDELPYVSIHAHVAREEIGDILPPLVPEVFGWLEANQVAPAGAPFFRYLGFSSDGKMDTEVGVPVAKAVAGSGRVSAGSFPAGRYAVVIHTGPYHEVGSAHMALMDWGEKNGIAWNQSADGSRWGVHVEFYITEPENEIDPATFETEVAFLLA